MTYHLNIENARCLIVSNQGPGKLKACDRSLGVPVYGIVVTSKGIYPIALLRP
jgi:hypothetical protein